MFDEGPLTLAKPSDFRLAGRRVWVAGHRGMVGSAVCRRLSAEDCEILEADRGRVDLRDQRSTEAWIAAEKPEVIVVAAARVGGILANSTQPADFIYDNLAIAANVIHAAARTGTEKLLFLGSSCIYPRNAPQPMSESALLTGPLEPTNEWYAIAKIAGIKLCQAYQRQHGLNFISAMPTNLYGPGDNFSPTGSHVLPALMQKVHKAKQTGEPIVIWGSGTPRREFLHVDDLADAVVFLLKNYSGEPHVNVGTGTDVSILELAEMIREVVDYHGPYLHDTEKPDGAPRKLLDVGMLKSLGWEASIDLMDGLRSSYAWYCQHLETLRR